MSEIPQIPLTGREWEDAIKPFSGRSAHQYRAAMQKFNEWHCGVAGHWFIQDASIVSQECLRCKKTFTQSKPGVYWA